MHLWSEKNIHTRTHLNEPKCYNIKTLILQTKTSLSPPPHPTLSLTKILSVYDVLIEMGEMTHRAQPDRPWHVMWACCHDCQAKSINHIRL